ncbi:glycosyltransferase family 2 protein [Penaeicola halotolerans]|uniref:glycosyltransferase family 2 protein n=1 Tax=Penaeicola halotolerans TaxID=2793196 RepID=UPI001CF8B698|nr:glycosyltransferase family 2 protein [Penaeicola halotolerans]
MKRAAVVILNYNGRQMLEQYLPSVIQHTEASIIIVDNNSSDDSVTFLQAHHPDLPLIQLDQNYGYSGGYAKVLETLQGQYTYYILLNSDVEVTPNWDTTLLAWLDEHPQYAAAQPKILSYQNRQAFDYAGAAGGYIDSLGYPYCRGRIFYTIEEDHGQYDEVKDIFWASGACIVLRSSAYHEVGGLDPDFFAHMEEIDLCWRLFRQGHKVACIPQSVVYHLGGGTLDRQSSFKTYLNFRNNLYLLDKNLPETERGKIIWMRLFLDGLAGLNYLIKGELRNIQAIIRAHRHYFNHRNEWRKKWKLASSLPRNRGLEKYFEKKNILKDYFIRGKKTYVDLIS